MDPCTGNDPNGCSYQLMPTQVTCTSFRDSTPVLGLCAYRGCGLVLCVRHSIFPCSFLCSRFMVFACKPLQEMPRWPRLAPYGSLAISVSRFMPKLILAHPNVYSGADLGEIFHLKSNTQLGSANTALPDLSPQAVDFGSLSLPTVLGTS